MGYWVNRRGDAAKGSSLSSLFTTNYTTTGNDVTYASRDINVRKRRVFFSFHYIGDDTWRANQVRNSWVVRKPDDREPRGFIDASIWGENERRGDESVKALLRQELENTSVTCVLAGAHTYSRRWVRYEIAQSVVRKNGLLTVKIHRLGDKDNRTSSEGPNPLDYMGVYRANGSIFLAEVDINGKWAQYKDYGKAISLPPGKEEPSTNVVIPLSRHWSIYDYKMHNGYECLGSWVDTAAMEAGR